MMNLKSNSSGAFRDCSLTKVLKNTLTDGAKVLFMINLAPEENFLEETKDTLFFGKSINSVKLDNS